MQRHNSATLLLLGLLVYTCGARNILDGPTATYGPETSSATPPYPTTGPGPTTSPQPATATTPPPVVVNQCDCTDKNIWLDIFFIIDASFAMTSTGFDGATSFVESLLYKMTIGQANAQQTRAAFITYSANAQMLYNLSYWQSTDDMINNMDLPYSGTRGTNIEAAIKLATSNMVAPDHRPNAQGVIVILASAYENGGYNDPTEAADTFKADGNTIITIEYVQEHGAEVPQLNKLASPGYSFTNRFGNLTAEQIRQSFCKVNCFCPTNYNSYTEGDPITPYGGCYRTVPISAIQTLAAKNCRQHHNGLLAKVESRDKSTFLSTLFPSKTKFWIGLKFDTAGNAYQWADGTYLSSSDFQMWAPGYPFAASGYCVYQYQYQGFSSGWFNDDCGDDWQYVCQSTPCSADNYCATRD
ncbi:hypothetical protein Q1695_015561 [Nippostrongylus brasiliensis]|nr:hypothetical protein Q1695_015561 [Nippostrongylus brasiliensis]